VIRYEPLPGQPAVGRRTITGVIERDWAVWRQDRSPLAIDSLKAGDPIKVWLRRQVASQPVDPPTLAVRAIQRIDSLPVSDVAPRSQ
jgi:hypothetical protein